jgi:hypothetical protein
MHHHATRRCLDVIGDRFFHDAVERVASVWGAPEHQRLVQMNLVLLMGRKAPATESAAALIAQQA